MSNRKPKKWDNSLSGLNLGNIGIDEGSGDLNFNIETPDENEEEEALQETVKEKPPTSKVSDERIQKLLNENEPEVLAKRLLDAQSWGTRQSQARAKLEKELRETKSTSAPKEESASRSAIKFYEGNEPAIPESLVDLFDQDPEKAVSWIREVARHAVAPNLERYVTEYITSRLEETMKPIIPVIDQVNQVFVMQDLMTKHADDFWDRLPSMNKLLQYANEKGIEVTPDQLYEMATEMDLGDNPELENNEKKEEENTSEETKENKNVVDFSTLKRQASRLDTESGTAGGGGELTTPPKIETARDAVMAAIEELQGSEE
jgi:hypothetical protein